MIVMEFSTATKSGVFEHLLHGVLHGIYLLAHLFLVNANVQPAASLIRKKSFLFVQYSPHKLFFGGTFGGLAWFTYDWLVSRFSFFLLFMNKA